MNSNLTESSYPLAKEGEELKALLKISVEEFDSLASRVEEAATYVRNCENWSVWNLPQKNSRAPGKVRTLRKKIKKAMTRVMHPSLGTVNVGPLILKKLKLNVTFSKGTEKEILAQTVIKGRFISTSHLYR